MRPASTGHFFIYIPYTILGRFMLKYQGSKFFELLIFNKVCYELKLFAILHFIMLDEKQS